MCDNIIMEDTVSSGRCHSLVAARRQGGDPVTRRRPNGDIARIFWDAMQSAPENLGVDIRDSPNISLRDSPLKSKDQIDSPSIFEIYRIPHIKDFPCQAQTIKG